VSSGEVAFETGAEWIPAVAAVVVVVVEKGVKSGIRGSNVGAEFVVVVGKSISGGEFDRELGAVAEVCRGVCHRPALDGVTACPADVEVEEKNVGTESID
jgi:hypothetical protein